MSTAHDKFLTFYHIGRRNGWIDRLIGERSEYSWHSVDSPNPETAWYCRGYQDGWNARSKGEPMNPTENGSTNSPDDRDL